ncbi:MAG: undecaprenyldiphospho-muramoylpentapeptide beta-N-acetylglucosaminyltransferase [Pseudomonadota bacterium]
MTINATIVLAAGGTGGHIFPAEALAEELQNRGYNVVLITDKRAREYKGILANIQRFTINAGTLGRGVVGKATAFINIAIGILQSRKILKQLKPIAVVGFGGYPSFPTVYAANMLGIPTIIHEQNSVLGKANRLLIKKAYAVATTFSDTRFIDPEFKAKTILTGNPVRLAIKALNAVPYPELSEDGNIRILVTGGSQGASIFSQIVPAAIAALPPSLRLRVRIDQQCRKEDLDYVRLTYSQMSVSADLSSFFGDIPARLAASHLVIARAGASTIAELTAAGRPSILVPLPGSMDNHQHYNANALEETGGGWVMPQEAFTAEALSARIESFLTLPESLARAAENARNMGKIYAASDLAAIVLNIAAQKQLR